MGWVEDTLQSRQDQVSIFGNGRLISVNSAWLLDLVRTSRISYVCQWRFKKNLKDLQDNYFALRDRNQKAESRVLVSIFQQLVDSAISRSTGIVKVLLGELEAFEVILRRSKLFRQI